MIWFAFREALTSLDSDTKARAKLGCISILTFPLLWLWRVIAFKILWGWFVVPFLGLPHLALSLAFGLGLVCEALQGFRYSPQSQLELKKFTVAELRQNFVVAWLIPGCALLLGLIIKRFI